MVVWVSDLIDYKCSPLYWWVTGRDDTGRCGSLYRLYITTQMASGYFPLSFYDNHSGIGKLYLA